MCCASCQCCCCTSTEGMRGFREIRTYRVRGGSQKTECTLGQHHRRYVEMRICAPHLNQFTSAVHQNVWLNNSPMSQPERRTKIGQCVPNKRINRMVVLLSNHKRVRVCCSNGKGIQRFCW